MSEKLSKTEIQSQFQNLQTDLQNQRYLVEIFEGDVDTFKNLLAKKERQLSIARASLADMETKGKELVKLLEEKV